MRIVWLVPLLVLSLSGCSSGGSGSSGSASSGGSGGTPGAAGRAASGGGSNSAGGASAGGVASANGGGSSGGAANGGGAAAQGGAGGATGGSPSGGSANGGSATGGGAGAPGGGAAGTGGLAGSGGAAGAVATTGTIVPLYTDPSDTSWSAIIAAKKAHPAVAVVAIVNPNSGPGNKLDASYTTGIDKLLAVQIIPIGYVSTSYTARGEPAVEADIDSWQSFYPKLSGIFFDEQSNQAGDDGFYRDVSQYAKQKGLSFTVGNPGTGVPAAYLDTVDVMLVYESGGLPSQASLAKYAAQRAHYGVIPYAAAFDAAFVTAAKADVKYVYATSDDLPNPWDTLTPYFDQLLTALSP